MGRKFCPKCGKKTEIFYDNLCEECFLKEISFVSLIPNKFLIKECKSCGRFFFKSDASASLEKLIESTLSKLLSKKEVESATYRIQDNKLHVNVRIKINGLKKEEKKISSLVVKKIVCRECALKSLEYYQSIIQVRAPEDVSNKILERMKRIVEKSKKEKLAFISKIEKVPRGFNAYIGSKRIAKEIVQEIKKEFKAKIKISRKLSGSIRGKRVYRDTILVLAGE